MTNALAGSVAGIYAKTTDAAVAFTDEATTDLAGAHTAYQITDTAKRSWDWDTAVTVKVDAITQTSGYTINYASGVVHFAAAQAPSAVVTVTGVSVALVQVAGAFDHSFKVDGAVKDVPAYDSDGWRELIRTLNSWTLDFSAYWSVRSTVKAFSECVKDGDALVVRLFTDKGAALSRFEGVVTFDKADIKGSADGVIEESLSAHGVGAPYYRTG